MKQTNKQVLIYYNFCNNEIERKMIHIHFDGATVKILLQKCTVSDIRRGVVIVVTSIIKFNNQILWVGYPYDIQHILSNSCFYLLRSAVIFTGGHSYNRHVNNPMHQYVSTCQVTESYIVWHAVPAAPYGQVPYIVYKGKKYGQSIAIASFFARKLGKFTITHRWQRS